MWSDHWMWQTSYEDLAPAPAWTMPSLPCPTMPRPWEFCIY